MNFNWIVHNCRQSCLLYSNFYTHIFLSLCTIVVTTIASKAGYFKFEFISGQMVFTPSSYSLVHLTLMSIWPHQSAKLDLVQGIVFATLLYLIYITLKLRQGYKKGGNFSFQFQLKRTFLVFIYNIFKSVYKLKMLLYERYIQYIWFIDLP